MDYRIERIGMPGLFLMYVEESGTPKFTWNKLKASAGDREVQRAYASMLNARGFKVMVTT